MELKQDVILTTSLWAYTIYDMQLQLL